MAEGRAVSAEVAPTVAIECEIAVIGGGPAGIAAATVAAELGGDIVLLDAQPRPGGQIWRHRDPAELPPLARRWLKRLAASGARQLLGSTVVDARHRDGGVVLLGEHGAGVVVVRAERIIVATGARELFLPFPGWTLPHIFGVGGAQALLAAGMSVGGKRVVVAGSGPLLPAVAARLVEEGAEVVLVAEQASRSSLFGFGLGLYRSPARLAQAIGLRARLRRVRYLTGTWVTAAAGTGAVEEVQLTDGRRSWTESCDILCTGYGLVPNVELAELLGCGIEGGRVQVDDAQRTTVERVYCAGEPTGIAGVGAALIEGEIAARAARAAEPTGNASLIGARRRERGFAERLERAFALRAELRADPPPGTLVCRCEDVPIEALEHGWSFRQAKLYTRIGMGTCQARVCGPICEVLRGYGQHSGRVPVYPARVATLLNGNSDR